ncbi:MAG: type II secretion system F family protein [Candidatus Diapherotrites archaeon]|nr:type II secretion system F family protein [Candidatus Diapherotrites archaeon]MDZ4256466.1 type II secretion system F family protein [archaeon]
MSADIGIPVLREIQDAFETQFRYLGMRISSRKFVINIVLMAFVLGVLSTIITSIFLQWNIILVFLGAAVVSLGFIGATYLLLDLQTEGRGSQVEKILPDALQLIASNIKSGLTTERALLVSARPEFGPLETELKRVSTRILSGMPVEKAILEIPRHIKSTLVERTVWLLARGISSGGEIADLLLQLSRNLRTQLALQSEARASISIYLILIFFSAAFGGPALYAVSSFIVQVMASQISSTPQVDPGVLAQAGSRFSGLSGFISGQGEIVDPQFIVLFAQIMLFVGGIFASLILGAIATGREKDGVKYIPVVLLFSFGLFYLVRFVLVAAFGDLLL